MKYTAADNGISKSTVESGKGMRSYPHTILNLTVLFYITLTSYFDLIFFQ